jgi:hypothetical protein
MGAFVSAVGPAYNSDPEAPSAFVPCLNVPILWTTAWDSRTQPEI